LSFYQPWTFVAVNELYGDLRFEHDFAPNLTGYIKAGGRRSNADYLLAFPTIINTSGATTATPRKTVLFNEGISAEVGGARQARHRSVAP
jgi:iron complex outermembrane receptor protein